MSKRKPSLPSVTVHIDEPTRRRLCVEYLIDPRSLMKELRNPGSVRGMAGERARAALAAFSAQSVGGAAAASRWPAPGGDAR